MSERATAGGIVNINRVAAVPGGTLQSATAQWQVATAVATAAGPVFRRVLYLRVPVIGQVAGVTVDPAASVLHAAFRSLDTIARVDGAAPLPLTRDGVSGAVILALTVPLRILGVRFASAVTFPPGTAIEFCRVHGRTVAEQATAMAPVSGRGATLPATTAFTDARFAVRARGPDASLVALAATQVEEVQVQGLPAGARLGVAGPAALAGADEDVPAPVTFFWRSPTPVIDAEHAAAGEVDAGRLLAGAAGPLLEGLIAAAPALNPPAAVELALVAESDQPCRLDLTALALAARLRGPAAPPGGGTANGKRTLRFGGANPHMHVIELTLPAGALAPTGAIDVVPSFRWTGAGGAAPHPAPIAQTRGVHLDARTSAAVPLAPEQGPAIAGVLLGLMALTAGAAVRVELRDGAGGGPAGAVLAQASASLPAPGERSWIEVRFARPVTIDRLLWLVAGCASGTAIWLANSADGAARVRVIGHREAGAGRHERGSLDGTAPLLQVVAPIATVAAGSAPPLTLMAAGQPLGPHTGIRPSGVHPDAVMYDLTPALGQALAAHEGGAEVRIPVTATSYLEGLATVYPARIEFDVADP